MRFHTDTLTESDVYMAADELPGVRVTVMELGSRSRARAFEVKLTGTSNRRVNPGTSDGSYWGVGRDHAATWDEWGIFIANLFDMDNNMFAGTAKHPVYANIYDFHHQTGERFYNLTAEQQHKNHRWDYDMTNGEHACQCGAVRRRQITELATI